MTARFGRRAAARGQAQDLDDPNLAVEREREDASCTDFLARLGDPPPVEPDIALLDDRLGDGPALGQANEEQEAVDPQISGAA